MVSLPSFARRHTVVAPVRRPTRDRRRYLQQAHLQVTNVRPKSGHIRASCRKLQRHCLRRTRLSTLVIDARLPPRAHRLLSHDQWTFSRATNIKHKRQRSARQRTYTKHSIYAWATKEYMHGQPRNTRARGWATARHAKLVDGTQIFARSNDNAPNLACCVPGISCLAYQRVKNELANSIYEVHHHKSLHAWSAQHLFAPSHSCLRRSCVNRRRVRCGSES